METCGIIAEYNPFHDGHHYQLQQVRKRLGGNVGIVVAMSGDFVQRGGPAISPKWQRAAWAVKHGADLVIELPPAVATATAERFAAGGVHLLNSLGIVRHLAFGAETDNLESLERIASLLAIETPQYQEVLRETIAQNQGFAAARANAVATILGEEYGQLLGQSNAILAVSYLIALQRQQSTMKPILIERKGPEENAGFAEQGLASASYLRARLSEARKQNEPAAALALAALMPSDVLADLMPETVRSTSDPLQRMFLVVLARLLSANVDELSAFEAMRPDLANRLLNAVNEKISPRAVESFIADVATRVYPASRVRRALTHLYLNLDDATVESLNPPAVIRVLAFSRRGRHLLKLMRTHATLPVIMRNSDVMELSGDARKQLAHAQKTADLYAILKDLPTRSDFDQTVSIG